MTEPRITDVESLIRDDEGEVLHGYQLNGIWHVGVGHNVEEGPPITPVASAAILSGDLEFFERAIRAHVPHWDELSVTRRGVLIDLAFNVGVHGLFGFVRMLQALSLGDYASAAREIRHSEAHDKQGLAARYDRLARIMESGVWP